MDFDFTGAPMSAARRVSSRLPSQARRMGADVSHRLQEMGSEAGDAAGRYYRQGERFVRDSAGDLIHTVEEQPIRSTLMAIGLGCLVAAFLIPRR